MKGGQNETAKPETRQQNMAPTDGKLKIAPGPNDIGKDDEGKHQSHEVSGSPEAKCMLENMNSATSGLVSIMEILGDRIMKLENAMEEEKRQRDLDNAWQSQVLKTLVEDNQRLKEHNNDLAMKLSDATTSSERYKEDYEKLKEQNNDLSVKLAAATTASQLLPP